MLKTRVRRQLEISGLDPGQLRADSVEVENIAEAVEQIAGEGDLLVLSEPREADRHTLFTRLNEEIRSVTDCPILVVLHAGDDREE
jgi:hypothetical protein